MSLGPTQLRSCRQVETTRRGARTKGCMAGGQIDARVCLDGTRRPRSLCEGPTLGNTDQMMSPQSPRTLDFTLGAIPAQVVVGRRRPEVAGRLATEHSSAKARVLPVVYISGSGACQRVALQRPHLDLLCLCCVGSLRFDMSSFWAAPRPDSAGETKRSSLRARHAMLCANTTCS